MSDKKSSNPGTQEPGKTPDPRVAGIATVGWVTIATLATCIPLVFMVGAYSRLLAGALPLAIILGAGLMTVRIWSSGEKTVNSKENEALKGRINELEERLANLEMVDSLEQHLAQRHQNSPAAEEESRREATMGPVQPESES